VAVLGVADPQWGEAGVAFVVAREGARPERGEIQRFLETRLARFKLPKAFCFVDALPRTAYGKVVKPELREWYQRRESA
jgi:acyl-CoA synthetase (AMP-forming)/AMP-acid ligase II